MIRLVGAACVAAGMAWIGFQAAWGLRSRLLAAEHMVAGLTLLERELTLRLSPIPELVQELACRTQGCAQALFEHLAQSLAQNQPLSGAWPEAVERLTQLGQEGRRILLPLGQVLGRYEAEGQHQAIAAARGELERLCHAQREETVRLGKVYRALGLTGGAFLVVLLL